MTNKICDMALSAEQMSNAIGTSVYPGQDPSERVQSGDYYLVRDPTLPLDPPGGIVRSFSSNDGRTWINITTPLHVFSGGIMRSIFASGGATYMTTRGVGTSPGIIVPPPVPFLIPGQILDAANQLQGPNIFNALDAALAARLDESIPGC